MALSNNVTVTWLAAIIILGGNRLRSDRLGSRYQTPSSIDPSEAPYMTEREASRWFSQGLPQETRPLRERLPDLAWLMASPAIVVICIVAVATAGMANFGKAEWEDAGVLCVIAGVSTAAWLAVGRRLDLI